jgi:hypothetical protein
VQCGIGVLLMHIVNRFIISRGCLAASLILSYQTGSHPIPLLHRMHHTISMPKKDYRYLTPCVASDAT